MRRFEVIQGLKNFSNTVRDRLASLIVSHSASNGIFNNLKYHVINQDFSENHIVYVIKIIVKLYFEIRLRQFCKNSTVCVQGLSLRQRNLKLTLFNGY